MGAFKTGIELQREKIAELQTAAMKSAGGRTPREQGNRGIGAMLGAGLAGAFLSKPGTAAGDILAAQEKPPSTAADWAKVQKDLFAAGLEDDGLSLTPKIKGLQEIEKSFGESSGKGDKAPKYVVTDADRALTTSVIGGRAETEGSVVGKTLAPFMTKDANPYQQAQATTFVHAVSEKAASLQAQLREKDIHLDRSMITEMLVDELEGSGAVQEDTSFLWFGEKGKIDTKKLYGSMKQYGDSVFKRLTQDESKPVQVAEPQRTTQAGSGVNAQTGLPMQETLPDGTIVGEPVEQEIVDQGTLIENPTFKAAITPINDKIQEYNRALKGNKSEASIKEIKRLKQIEIDKSRAIRKAFGQTIR